MSVSRSRLWRVQVPIAVAIVLAAAAVAGAAGLALATINVPKNSSTTSANSDSGQAVVIPTPGDPIPAGHVPILMYHYIRVNPDPRDTAGKVLSVSPDNFNQQMQWAHDHGFQAISLEDLYNALRSNKKLDRRSMVLTFDDGYADFYTAAWPVLKKFGYTATAYIVTGFLGKPGYMTWDQVVTLDRAGITIGAHTMTHPDLTTTNKATLQAQVDGSKSQLADHLGHPPVDFCYPSGRFNVPVVGAVTGAGFRDATTTVQGAFESLNTAYFWPRVRISGGDSLGAFTQQLSLGINEYQKYGDKAPPGIFPAPGAFPSPAPSAPPSTAPNSTPTASPSSYGGTE